MINEQKVTKVVCTQTTNSAPGRSCVLGLTMLALLADFFVFVIDFFWKLKSRSAMSETLWCHTIMLQMEFVELSLILELVMIFSKTS